MYRTSCTKLCAYKYVSIVSILACCLLILRHAHFLALTYSTTVKIRALYSHFNFSATRLICHDFKGRLGNTLFQYASILGLTYRANKTALFLGYNQLDTILKVPPPNPSVQDGLDSRCSTAISLQELMAYRFDEKLTMLDPEVDYKINGYLQSWKYFDQFEERIREAVRFSDDVNERAARVVKDIRDMYNHSQLVGVHVRRGDFLQPYFKKHGYPVAGPEYFQRSFDFFQTRFNKVTFIIVSEDTIWCKENMPKDYAVHFLSPHEAEIDMAILALLDHMIITFGTFSWWAGFLNQGITVHVKDFIREGTTIGKQLAPNGTDYIHPEWILL